MRMVGRGLQAHGLDGGGHGPEALARDEGRGGLHHRVATGREALVQQCVEAVGEELANGEVGRIGEVHDDDVEGVLALLQPLEGILVHHRDLGRGQRIAIEAAQRGVLAKEPRHRGVQLHQRDRLHSGIAQHLAHRHAVPSAQHRHALRSPVRGHRGMDQGLVVAVFVAFGELQVAVQVQAMPRAPVRDHDALVGRGAAEHDAVLVELVLGKARDVLGPQQPRQQGRQHQRTGQRVRAKAPQLMPEQPQRPHGHGRVHEAEQQPRAHQPQLRHQQQRERHRHGQRAKIVESEHLAHQVLELHVALEDAHDERDLQAHQRAHQQHHAVQQHAERTGHVGIGQEQHGRQRPADKRHQQLDAQEMRGQLPIEVTRQPRAYAHGEQIGADDGGELQHRVAQHVRRQRPRRQLVQQAAGGDDEDAGEQGDVDGAGARQGYGRGCDARGAARSAHASAVSSCCAKPSMVSQPNTARAPLVRAHSSPTWRFSIS